MVMLHIKLKGMKRTTSKQITTLTHTVAHRVNQNVKIFFLVAYQINSQCFALDGCILSTCFDWVVPVNNALVMSGGKNGIGLKAPTPTHIYLKWRKMSSCQQAKYDRTISPLAAAESAPPYHPQNTKHVLIFERGQNRAPYFPQNIFVYAY